MTLSQDEHYVFATNENDGIVSVIDFQRLRAHNFGSDALIGQIPLGTAPVGMAVSPDNRFLYITSEADGSVSSTQGTGGTCGGVPQGSLSVLDTKQALTGKAAVLATIDVGAFPRELTLEANGQTLLLTNYNSSTLSIIDVAKLPGQG